MEQIESAINRIFKNMPALVCCSDISNATLDSNRKATSALIFLSKIHPSDLKNLSPIEKMTLVVHMVTKYLGEKLY
jgi:hypothetical protein